MGFINSYCIFTARKTVHLCAVIKALIRGWLNFLTKNCGNTKRKNSEFGIFSYFIDAVDDWFEYVIITLNEYFIQMIRPKWFRLFISCIYLFIWSANNASKGMISSITPPTIAPTILITSILPLPVQITRRNFPLEIDEYKHYGSGDDSNIIRRKSVI